MHKTNTHTQSAGAVEEEIIEISEDATEEEAEKVGESNGVGNSREWGLRLAAPL